MKKTLLLVCTGNTCRSPLAEVYVRHFLGTQRENWEVYSAGVAVNAPFGANSNVIKLAQEEGFNMLDHKARQLRPEDLDEADLVLVMTPAHRAVLYAAFPEHRKKTFTMHEYLEIEGEVGDPYGGGLEEYDIMAQNLRELTQKVVEKICREEGK